MINIYFNKVRAGPVTRFGVIDRSVGRSPCARRRDRPKRRTVALRASVGSTEVTVCLSSSTLTTPCARAPRRSAEAKNFPIGIARSWSWAIGSSTSAAQRSFDGVVSRRSARPFASIAELGLPVNGRPYPNGMALEPGPCSRD